MPLGRSTSTRAPEPNSGDGEGRTSREWTSASSGSRRWRRGRDSLESGRPHRPPSRSSSSPDARGSSMWRHPRGWWSVRAARSPRAMPRRRRASPRSSPSPCSPPIASHLLSTPRHTARNLRQTETDTRRCASGLGQILKVGRPFPPRDARRRWFRPDATLAVRHGLCPSRSPGDRRPGARRRCSTALVAVTTTTGRYLAREAG